MLGFLRTYKTLIGAKVRNFVCNERGDVNIVSIVVLIGVAVILAILFKDAIGDLLTNLLQSIQGNASGTAKDTLTPVELPS